MLTLPSIPEKTETSIYVRRHSIDGHLGQKSQITKRFSDSAHIDPFYLKSQVYLKPNTSSLKELEEKYKDYNYNSYNNFVKQQQSKITDPKKVRFSTENEALKLPKIIEPINNVNYQRESNAEDNIEEMVMIKPNYHLSPIKKSIEMKTNNNNNNEVLSKKRSVTREDNYKKNYLKKTEDKRRSFSYNEKTIKKLNSLKKNSQKRSSVRRIEENEQSAEMENFVSMVKRLNIGDGQTPPPEELKAFPTSVRHFANLSLEAQYALMKTYEDTIANEIAILYPNLTTYIPRIVTSKFRRTLHEQQLPTKHLLQPIRKRNEMYHSLRLYEPQEPYTAEEYRMENEPQSILVTEHQLHVSQQLEIAQGILDLIKKIKGEYTTDIPRENSDILKNYSAFVKIWTKYFHLR